MDEYFGKNRHQPRGMAREDGAVSYDVPVLPAPDNEEEEEDLGEEDDIPVQGKAGPSTTPKGKGKAPLFGLTKPNATSFSKKRTTSGFRDFAATTSAAKGAESSGSDSDEDSLGDMRPPPKKSKTVKDSAVMDHIQSYGPSTEWASTRASRQSHHARLRLDLNYPPSPIMPTLFTADGSHVLVIGMEIDVNVGHQPNSPG